MTRKDFEAIAAALNQVRPPSDMETWGQWADCCFAIMEVCKKHNTQFSERTFLIACGFTAAHLLDRK